MRLLVNALGGYSGYVTDYDAARSYARVDAPSRMDLETGLNTGSHELHQNKTRDRYQSTSPIPARTSNGRPQAAYRGAAFVANQVSNSPNDDRFHSMELTVTRRTSGRWMAQASYFAVKNHRWINRASTVFNTPNDGFFPLDETRSWAGTVIGSYRLPGDVMLSAFLQSKNGVRGQRTYIFRSTDPDGGRSIAQLNTVTLRLEPYGSRSLAAINILNLRAGKEFSLRAGTRFGVDVDVFDALNSKAPTSSTSATFASGPTFGDATAVLPARVARVGARFRF